MDKSDFAQPEPEQGLHKSDTRRHDLSYSTEENTRKEGRAVAKPGMATKEQSSVE